jgi:hypothetical protein
VRAITLIAGPAIKTRSAAGYAARDGGIRSATKEAMMTDQRIRTRGGRLGMPRSRGAMSGLLLILLGAWGALIPFVGPYLDFSFTPDQAWLWTDARGWLEVLPGAVAALGGLLLLVSSNRATAMLGGWMAVIAGAWFVAGRVLAGPLGIGEVGSPVAGDATKSAALELAYFYGLGALIVFLGAAALGRVSVRSVRDVEFVDNAVTPAAAGPVAAATTTAAAGEAYSREPAFSDQPTEVQPAGAAMRQPTERHHEPEERRHRGLRDLFGRRKTAVH